MDKAETRVEKFKVLREKISALPDDFETSAHDKRIAKIDEIVGGDDTTIEISGGSRPGFDGVMKVHESYGVHLDTSSDTYKKARKKELFARLGVLVIILVMSIGLLIVGIWAFGGF